MGITNYLYFPENINPECIIVFANVVLFPQNNLWMVSWEKKKNWHDFQNPTNVSLLLKKPPVIHQSRPISCFPRLPHTLDTIMGTDTCIWSIWKSLQYLLIHYFLWAVKTAAVLVFCIPWIWHGTLYMVSNFRWMDGWQTQSFNMI